MTQKVNELIALRENSQDIKNAANQIREKVTVWGVSGAGETREGLFSAIHWRH